MIAALLPYRWTAIALLAAAAVGFMGIQHAQIAGLRADLAQAKAQHAQAVADAASAAEAQSERYRLLEQRTAQKQQEALDAHAQQLAQARADAVAAGAAADRLQRRVSALVAQAGRSTANPVAAAVCPSAGTAVDLLADVQRRAWEAAGQLAEYADRARVAGELCVSSYEALTPAP